jgi:xylitol oxidase
MPQARREAVAPQTPVAAALHARGWALNNLGSLLASASQGACATGTHGSGDSNGNLASAVVGVEMVRADGELDYCAEGGPKESATRSACCR